MAKFFRNNGLSIVFFALFLFSMAGQVFTGLNEYYKEREDDGATTAGLSPYLSSGHFLQATFEGNEGGTVNG